MKIKFRPAVKNMFLHTIRCLVICNLFIFIYYMIPPYLLRLMQTVKRMQFPWLLPHRAALLTLTGHSFFPALWTEFRQ